MIGVIRCFLVFAVAFIAPTWVALAIGVSGSPHAQVIYVPPSGCAGPCVPLVGFYVATAAGGGSDSNSGTFAAPFATLGKCQTAMQASGTIKTCYVRAGTYTIGATFSLSSNETFSGYPLDPNNSAIINTTLTTTEEFLCNPCSNVTFQNFTFGNGPTGAGVGQFRILNGSSNVHIESNIFNSTNASSALVLFDADPIYVRGNHFNNSGTNVQNVLNLNYDDANTHHGVYITDNVFNLCNYRYCAEVLVNTTVTDFHFDRNNIQNWTSSVNGVCGGFGATSFVSPNLAGDTNATVYGNTVTISSSFTNTCAQAFELVWNNLTTSNNTVTNASSAFSIGTSPAIFNNTITLQSANTVAGGVYAHGQDDGAYNAAEWIGTNTVNGTQYTGCNSTICLPWPGTPAWPTYGAQPAVNPPSAPFP